MYKRQAGVPFLKFTIDGFKAVVQELKDALARFKGLLDQDGAGDKPSVSESLNNNIKDFLSAEQGADAQAKNIVENLNQSLFVGDSVMDPSLKTAQRMQGAQVAGKMAGTAGIAGMVYNVAASIISAVCNLAGFVGAGSALGHSIHSLSYVIQPLMVVYGIFLVKQGFDEIKALDLSLIHI